MSLIELDQKRKDQKRNDFLLYLWNNVGNINSDIW